MHDLHTATKRPNDQRPTPATYLRDRDRCTEAPVYLEVEVPYTFACVHAFHICVCACVCVMKSPPADERQPTLLALLLLCDELSYTVHIRYVCMYLYDRYGGVRGRGGEGRGERESSEGERTFGYLVFCFLIFDFLLLFFVSRHHFFFIVGDIYHVLFKVRCRFIRAFIRYLTTLVLVPLRYVTSLRDYILSTGVSPSSCMPLFSTIRAASYMAISAIFFSRLSAYMTLNVFAFLLLRSIAS